MVTQKQLTKAFKTYGKFHKKAMVNVRKRFPGIHALDVSDAEIIKYGKLLPKEKSLFRKSAKILDEYQSEYHK